MSVTVTPSWLTMALSGMAGPFRFGRGDRDVEAVAASRMPSSSPRSGLVWLAKGVRPRRLPTRALPPPHVASRPMVTRWDPQQYLRYESERERPFAELLSRINHPDPKEIVDLGCGPGTTTVHLLQRWPDAHVVGIDSSPDMIAHARPLESDRLEFRQGDLRQWQADRAVDVLLTSATLQWVPDHEAPSEFHRQPGPWRRLRLQVPANFGAPSHTLLYELAQSDRWRRRGSAAWCAPRPSSSQPATCSGPALVRPRPGRRLGDDVLSHPSRPRMRFGLVRGFGPAPLPDRP